MCRSYVLVSKLEKIESRYNVVLANGSEFISSYNITSGKQSMIITQEEPHLLHSGQFGFSPSWAKKQMLLVNARAEGDHNLDDNPNYKGGLGILQKPSFMEAIRNKRCLVIADCFYQGSKEEGLNKPYVVYLRDRRPFSFAGIYNTWKDKETGESILTFAIITTQANELMQRIGNTRSPVILSTSTERQWIHGGLSHATSLLHPYSAKLMNAYPISSFIKNSKIDDNNLVRPTGEKLYKLSNDFVMKKSVRGGFNV